MVRRVAGELGVRRDVGEPDRAAFLQERPEEPVEPGQVADARPALGGDADREEGAEAAAPLRDGTPSAA